MELDVGVSDWRLTPSLMLLGRGGRGGQAQGLQEARGQGKWQIPGQGASTCGGGREKHLVQDPRCEARAGGADHRGEDQDQPGPTAQATAR